jgi:hypothetical protein
MRESRTTSAAVLMPWYKVVKTINGGRYLYWQRTYRVGKSVKTENRYIGPATARPPPTIASPTYSASAPDTPERVVSRIRPFYSGDKVLERFAERQRREDEAIQYGPLKHRLKRMQAKIRAAKRNAKGNKYLNPFLGQAIKKK